MQERTITGEFIHTETPIEMFRELVEGALDHQHLAPSEESAFYLVSLLDGFVRPKGLYADLGTCPEQALGEILLSAIQYPDPQRFVLFQLTGDLALFLSGFFADSLDKRQVTPDYYRQLGETAYSQAAGCAQPNSRAGVFEELAENFGPFTGVLNEVSERCTMLDMRHLLRLYERYSATGNPRDAELLQSQGITLPGPGEDLIH